MTRSSVLRVLAVGAAVMLGAGVWVALGHVDREGVAQQVRDLGPLGPVAVVLLLIGQCVVAPVPSEPIMLAVGFVYGPMPAFTLAWTGVVLGAAACYALARRLGRPFAERFVRRERLHALDVQVQGAGVARTFAIVLGIRLAAFSSFDILSYACGLIRMPFRWFALATAIGAVPKVFAFTYSGSQLQTRPGWLDALILGGTFGVLVALPWLVRRWRTRLDSAAPPA
jgi:uncharacterized membrane protein YdjX (TVP38/TMEM64 family)